MKLLITGAVCLGIGVVGGMVISRNLQNTAAVPAPVAESVPTPAKDETPPERISTPRQEPKPMASQVVHETAQAPITNAPENESKSQKATQLSWAIDTLVSPSATYQQKKAVWEQLKNAGQLDQAIEALKQGAADNPNNAAYPAALGQADLLKASVISKNGGSINEMGILGMQADQNFDAALKIDPSNWGAQFTKAVAMSYWPAELNKGPEVIQRLSSLIDQQETMPSQPQFAGTYLYLGEQYMKAGQQDYAQQTWQLGAARFPTDVALQAKIAGK